MKISAISDVHVKKSQDEAYQLLLKFLNHPFVENSDYIFFLGDIFDLMCGPHFEYFYEFQELFEKIKNLMRQGKKVYFFEGNHDLHLEELFKKIFNNLSFTVRYGFLELTIENKKYLLTHGDEFDYKNRSYHFYRNFIQSPPLKYFAENILPFSVLNFFGEKASVASRKKGKRSFNEIEVRDKFRNGVDVLLKDKSYDIVLGGHSHVKDLYQMKNQSGIYVNNGYALNTKTFIAVEDHIPRFERLV